MNLLMIIAMYLVIAILLGLSLGRGIKISRTIQNRRALPGIEAEIIRLRNILAKNPMGKKDKEILNRRIRNLEMERDTILEGR